MAVTDGMGDLRDRLIPKLDVLREQFDTLERQLADPAVVGDHRVLRDLSIKRSAIADIVLRYEAFCRCQRDLAEMREILDSNEDAELSVLAREQLPALESDADRLIEEIAGELVTADDRAIGSIILEIRSASGGAEAALWAGELFEMYCRFATSRGFSETTLGFSPGEQGGVRHAVASVGGEGVWQAFGYEGGVHCVKRVPQTEAQGRVHTSTATVAVLPEPQEVQIDIPSTDVQVNITTAQGPGGQNVNKVATAVHMIHLPTGIEVRMQESKSQHQNRQRAWQLLRARVFDHFQRAEDANRAEARSKMIGGGVRSERIRTYRFKENLVVDHRLGVSFNLGQVLDGQLEPVVDGLVALDRAQRLESL